jgi:hypothetical protein
MALNMNFIDKNMEQIENGYIKITNTIINKNECYFSLGFWKNHMDSITKPSIKEYNNSFHNPNIEENIWIQVYTYCKTLPEFSEATDII